MATNDSCQDQGARTKRNSGFHHIGRNNRKLIRRSFSLSGLSHHVPGVVHREQIEILVRFRVTGGVTVVQPQPPVGLGPRVPGLRGNNARGGQGRILRAAPFHIRKRRIRTLGVAYHVPIATVYQHVYACLVEEIGDVGRDVPRTIAVHEIRRTDRVRAVADPIRIDLGDAPLPNVSSSGVSPPPPCDGVVRSAPPAPRGG